MKRRAIMFLVCLATAAGASAARGQGNPQTRQGFWFSGGLGWGTLGCADCDGRTGGFSGGLSLGGTLSSKVLFGVGTTGWTKSEDGATLTVGTLDARVRFYPSAKAARLAPRGPGSAATVRSVSACYWASATTSASAKCSVSRPIGTASQCRRKTLTPTWASSAWPLPFTDARCPHAITGETSRGIVEEKRQGEPYASYDSP